MILHGIEYQRPTSLNMRILADHVTYSFLAFMKSIFHFCLGCYCGGYSQNGRSNLSSWKYVTLDISTFLQSGPEYISFCITRSLAIFKIECSINVIDLIFMGDDAIVGIPTDCESLSWCYQAYLTLSCFESFGVSLYAWAIWSSLLE